MNKQINPAAVQHHRRRQDISQEELAERVKDRQERGILSKRHLQRIERKAQLPGPHYVREEVLLALARALRVSPSRLQEVPEDSSQVQTETSGRVPLPPIKVRASTATKLDLVRSAYKVTLEEIIDLAPLMFVYHAESSLRERRERLERDLATRETLLRAFPKLQQLLDSDKQRGDARFAIEDESLRADDVFGWFIDPEMVQEIEIRDNPFTLYLQRLSERLRAPDKLAVAQEDPALLVPGMGLTPEYQVCRGHLDWLTGGDSELRQAILERRVLIDNFPSGELGFLDFLNQSARVDWIRSELARQQAASAPEGGGFSQAE